MATSSKKIGFIGTGRMGEALIRGILASSLFSPDKIYASDADFTKLESLSSEYKINICKDNCDSVLNSDILVIAVKPQIVPKVLEEIKNSIKNQLLLLWLQYLALP
jgi:pyrroline-5-carboxylate reductase